MSYATMQEAVKNDLYCAFHDRVMSHLEEGKAVSVDLISKKTGDFVDSFNEAREIGETTIDHLLNGYLSKETCDEYIVLFRLGERTSMTDEQGAFVLQLLSVVLQIGINCSLVYNNHPKNKTNPFALENKIVSLMAQHKITPDQAAAGVVDTPEGIFELVREASTFRADANGNPPTMDQVRFNANSVSKAVIFYHTPIQIEDHFYLTGTIRKVMIGGAPFFMPKLEKALLDNGINVHYAFTERVVQEVAQPDGTVQKVSKFAYLGDIVENPPQPF